MVTVADRYDLLEALGHGGMARVYLATDRVLGRRVAMKLLRDDIGRDDVLRERFLREARLAAGLAHRNIIRVFDAGVDDATPWIAMELVEGPSLREEMTRRGPYPAAEAVTLMTQVLDALAAAHAAGVVHRDVKPANILLAADGPKLGDFGIAKSLEGGGVDLTQTNQFMGTPKYTAPEVAMGLAATPQADVYAAGVVLWEALAGWPPYEHENPLALAMMHRTDPLPSLAPVRPDLPTSLVAAIEAGLAKEPADRPVGAAAFAAILQDGLAGRAAIAQTAVLPRVPPPLTTPPVREQTVAMPRPRRAAPPPPQPARRGRGLGFVAVVALLLVLAALAATRLDLETGAPPPTTAPTPTVAPTTEPTTTEPAAPPAPAPAPTAPEPTPTPTTVPTIPGPTTAPTAEPTATPTPTPTATEPPLLPVPRISEDG